jgi:hypothetical protein
MRGGEFKKEFPASFFDQSSFSGKAFGTINGQEIQNLRRIYDEKC